jgi:hypothetical protein
MAKHYTEEEVPERYRDCKYLKHTLVKDRVECQCLKKLYCAFDPNPCFLYRSQFEKKQKTFNWKTAFFKED